MRHREGMRGALGDPARKRAELLHSPGDRAPARPGRASERRGLDVGEGEGRPWGKKGEQFR